MSEVVSVDARLRSLPKAHLHVHVDGSYPEAAVRALAEAQGRTFRVPERFADVWGFFDAYGTVPELVRSHDDLAALVRAMVVEQAADGVRYLEPAIEPQLYAPRLGSPEQVLRTMLTALREGADEAAHPIEVGANLTVNTDADAPIADELAALAARFAGDGVTAFGTACFDEDAGLEPFVAAAARARATGLPVVSHAGQTGGPLNVVAVIEMLGASRISHGFRAAESERVVDRLAEDGVVCDVAPVSNVRLGVVPSLAEHPARRLIAAGVPVTLNADDPLWFGAEASDQYRIARDDWGLDDETLAGIARNGTRATGMSDATRAAMHDDIDAWCRA